MPQQQALEANRSATPYILFILGLLYTLSPIDILPDFIPVVGWVDDGTILLVVGLNLLEKGLGIKSPVLISILRFFKWTVIILGTIAIALLAFLVIFIWKTFIH